MLSHHSRTFLSRPRRFGKSLFVSTLEAALQGKKELFKNFWISRSHLELLDLIFQSLVLKRLENSKSLLSSLIDIEEAQAVFIEPTSNINVCFKNLIKALYKKHKSVSVLIDEYDHPILHTLHHPALSIKIRNVMKSFSCIM